MAKLLLENNTIYHDLSDIEREITPLGIQLRHFDPGSALLFPDLPNQDMLADTQKREILELHNSLFEFLKQEGSFLWNDLLVLHPGSPNLHTLVTTYSRYHTHNAPEAYYVLAGEAIIGLLKPDGSQLQLLIEAQDYLHIPTKVEHWFSPSATLNFKAVRYFANVEGWVPQYTGTKMSEL